MTTLKEKIYNLTKQNPGLTDREITDILLGPGKPQQSINQTCRALESQGILQRKNRNDGRIGNYPTGKKPDVNISRLRLKNNHDVNGLSEDEIKIVEGS